MGSQGGAIKSNPSYSNSLKILGYPNAVELAQIIASVGLAQNFAALRALSIEGIQKGHMNLHARNVAIRAEIPQNMVNETVNFMKARNKIDDKTAKMFFNSHQVYMKNKKHLAKKSLSSFYVEIRLGFLPEPLILTVLLDYHSANHTGQTYHLSIEKEPKHTAVENELVAYLLGGNKGYKWLTSFLSLLHSIRYNRSSQIEADLLMTQNKLKVLTILTNFVATHLLTLNQRTTFDFIGQLINLINTSF